MNKTPSISTGIKGFALASIWTVVIADSLRLPIEAYYSGMGLISILSLGSPFAFVLGALLVFAALMLGALPIWLVYRHLGLAKFWQFCVTGIICGMVLASRVHLEDYKETDLRAWTTGQTTIRPVVDALSFFLYGFLPFVFFWLFVYRYWSKESAISEEPAAPEESPSELTSSDRGVSERP